MNDTYQAISLHHGVPTHQSPELRIVSHAGARFAACKLDIVSQNPPKAPSIEHLLTAVQQGPPATTWMLWGGEPTLRPDLPALLSSLHNAGAQDLGMMTDGLALASPAAMRALQQVGLTHVRLIVASARDDAHDWLMGQPGAWRRTVRVARMIQDAGIKLEIDCPLTRPTVPYIEESVGFFARLGASRVWLRRLTGNGAARADDIALLARMGLCGPELERATALGIREGMQVVLEGIPLCATPLARAHALPVGAIHWAVAPHQAEPPFEDTVVDESTFACPTCPGAPACAGAPQDLVRRFGQREITSLGQRHAKPATITPLTSRGGDVFPPARALRTPVNRLSDIRRTLPLESLGDDPLVLIPAGAPPTSIRLAILAPSPITAAAFADTPAINAAEPTRAIRIRLAQAAQQGATTLRLSSAGLSHHPFAAALIREATRLMFPRVEVAGELSGLAQVGDLSLRRLRGLTRIDAALLAPTAAQHDDIVGISGAFEQTLALLDRAASLIPGVQTGVYAILQNPADLEAFADGWLSGAWHGEPTFRLAAQGGDLRKLAEIASGLPDGPVRQAIGAVLPCALFDRDPSITPAPCGTMAFGDLPPSYARPSATDRYGTYEDRQADAHNPRPGTCPGYATGWSR